MKRNKTPVKIIIEVEIPEIGNTLREKRQSLDLSQTKVAANSDMSQANLNRIEKEEAKGVPFPTLIKIASAIGIDDQLKQLIMNKVNQTIIAPQNK